MSATLRVPDVDQNQAVDQVSIACERIAPSWPLDRWIAVNPWWGHRHQGIEEAAIELVSRRGQGMLMAPEFYLEAWHGGRIQEGDLIAAARAQGLDRPAELLLEQLSRLRPRDAKPGLALQRFKPSGDGDALSEATQFLGLLCGRYFDHRQGQWLTNTKEIDLYCYWLSMAGPRGLVS
ncbi:MAG: DUF2309 domain-containing protein, partial [Marinobacter sp.]|nr:DUF2309 domain-containing protein [Marinobacter sp.]